MPLTRGWKLARAPATLLRYLLLRRRIDHDLDHKAADQRMSLGNPARQAALAFLRQNSLVIEALDCWWDCALRSALLWGASASDDSSDQEQLMRYIDSLPKEMYTAMLEKICRPSPSKRGCRLRCSPTRALDTCAAHMVQRAVRSTTLRSRCCAVRSVVTQTV